MKNRKFSMKAGLLAILLGLGISVLFSGAQAFAQSTTTGVNLIANPSLEIQSGKLPQYWSKGGNGKNNTVVYTYPVSGCNSQKAAKVEITKYSLGDAKWYPNYVSASSGQSYLFMDNYISNTTTSIVVAYSMKNGTFKYVQIATLSAADTWKTAQKTFTAPSGVKSMTVFHLLSGVGQLTVDNYYLTKAVLGAVAPYVDITSPKNEATVSGTIQLIADTGASTDVAGVQFMIDGANVGSEVTATPYQMNFDTTALANGTHTVSATVRDKYGTKGTSNPVKINVSNIDLISPTVALTGLIDGQIITGTITLNASATDNIGVAGVQFIIDGVNFGAEDTAAPYQISVDTTSLYNGNHYIAASARDAAGNKATSSAVLVMVINTNPNPTPTPTSSAVNLIKNPSLETADDSGNSPLYWNQGGWGTNQTTFTYPVAGNGSEKAAKIEMTQYTSGDAKWYFDDVAVTPGSMYEFSDYYMSNSQTTLTYRFNLSDGTYAYDDLGYPAASESWQQFTKTLQAPASASSLTVFHILNKVGYLTVDDFSLTEVPVAGALSQGMVSLEFDDGWLTTYQNAIPILNTAGLKSTQYIISGEIGNTDDGYVSASDILAMQASGHEIGSHSRTHANLTTLSSTDLQNEVTGSKQDLLNTGVSQVESFAYPYGATNSTVITAVKAAGYTGARGIDFGLNNKNTDYYNLVAKSVELSTTVNTVKAWIDDALLNKQWLILYFHNVDNSGEQYSTTPANLQAIVNYLTENSVKVVTNSDGVQILAQ
jgi:peptidoglycan/xylan/chitin deacetylase (PgdA/CDA1 family)